MKTILEIAKECGAYKFRNFGDIIDKVCFTEAKLTATIDLWNRQNSEPIYEIDYNRSNIWQAVHADFYSLREDIYPRRIVYLAPKPPASPASQELLDYVDRLEQGLVNALEAASFSEYYHDDIEYKQLIESAEFALQSKPAKG